MENRTEQIRSVIDHLNAIQTGELAAIRTRLAVATERLRALGESDLEKTLGEAERQLFSGNGSEFRRLLAQTVARLGHLR